MCPLTGDECYKHACDWYIHIIGVDPQSNKHIDQFGCSIKFIPLLLIENSRLQNQTAAAIESLRNEVVGAAKLPRLDETPPMKEIPQDED
jgi:hypothetical protein